MTNLFLSILAGVAISGSVMAYEASEQISEESNAEVLDQELDLDSLDLQDFNTDELLHQINGQPQWGGGRPGFRPPRPPRPQNPWRPQRPHRPYPPHYQQPQYPQYPQHPQPPRPQYPQYPQYPQHPQQPQYPQYPQHPPAHHGSTTMECYSIKYKNAYCNAPRPFRNAWVATQHSNNQAPCILGQTWGHDGRGIWVNSGCRATFAIQ